ncbi:MAG: hypothetical protein ACM33V_07085 [Chloroflexota bacterium]|nr:hypothetical protein [Anaerolineales bacterium]
MKTKWSYRSTLSNEAGGSLLQKILLISIAIILMVTSLPVSSVFAAPANDGEIPWTNDLLDQEWSNKISYIRMQNVFYAQAKLYPSDYKKPEDMARPYELLNKFGSALKDANAIITAHEGFDETGDVINMEKAIESVRKLSDCIHTMRGSMAKFEEEGYKLHKVK